jgi:D-3-phosphoglycerate dehydrogenase
MFKVVVTDHVFDNLDIQRGVLKDIAEVQEFQCETEDEVIAAAADADAVMTTNYQHYTARVLETLNKCRVIVRTGIGVDSVDVPAATRLGIMVVNIPSYCLDEVSDHAVTLMLSLHRKIMVGDQEVHTSLRYRPKEMRPIKGLKDTLVGIVGFGRIARLSAKKLAPFGCSIQFYDPYVDADVVLDGVTARKVSFETLMATSDDILVHAPYTSENYHLLGDSAFEMAQNKPYIVNVGRGELVDNAALIRAIRSGKVSGAGLDVSENADPFDPKDKILCTEGVLLTPHSAWYSERSFTLLQKTAAEETRRVLCGQIPLSLVNKEVLARARAKIDD